MITVFTPTHRPEVLRPAWDSLKDQAGDWEWLIVPNGAAKMGDLACAEDLRRVRVVTAPSWMQGIGALKRFCCEQAKGDVLVELDHDDRLADGALGKIQAAVDAGAGFVYSDFANVRDTGSCEVYESKWGWETYEPPNTKDIIAHRAFEPSAASLHRIFYAPNHVRAWTRDAYDRSGGHNPNMPVGDDHDLVCRTYLAGVEFSHIPKCLYYYRLHADGNQAYLNRNAEIQTVQEETSKRYLHSLVAEECRRKKLPMYDLGGRIGCPAGYKSIDLDDADVLRDVRAGLPFEDSSVGCIRAFDFLEHIPHCRDSSCDHGARQGAGQLRQNQLCTVGVMNEIYRVLVPGGWLLTGTPSSDGRGAFQDPTHCSFWNPNSLWYYTRAEQAKYLRGMTAKFQAVRVEQYMPNDWCRNNNIPYVYADLVALKEQRQPGLKEI